jgi:acetolactate synthase I/II/III large subunit
VSFFAYPGKASDLVPDDCQVHTLAGPGDDVLAALDALVTAAGVKVGAAPSAPLSAPPLPTGALNAETACAAIGALLPEGAIVSDEANTSGLFAAGATAGAPPHDWLCLTGGAIGQGLPVALGAAVAAPDRRVVALEADGSALYTLQSWWTMAREGLDVTTVLFNNGSYAILNLELNRVGVDAAGPRAREMLDLRRPDLDFVSLARGMGLTASRATTADEFVTQLRSALNTPGPSVVEALIPPAV